MLPTNLKHSVLACSLLAALLASAGQAQAACTGNTRISSVTTLSNLLQNKTVCFPATTVDPMTWQEKHVRVGAATTGALIDFKRGPGHPVDPSETVGTWTVAGNNGGQQAAVTHDYGGGATYTYTVHDNGDGTHSFCNGGQEFITAIRAGPGC